MPYVKRNERKIFYVVDRAQDDKSAETIILIHTNISDHTLYDRMVPYLTERYDVIRYDLAGFGRSDRGDEPISVALYVDDLHHLITTLQLGRVYLAGIGFGGFIGLHYSIAYSDGVTKLALMSLPCFPAEILPAVRQHRQMISDNGTKIPIDNLLKKTTGLAENDPEYGRLQAMIGRTTPFMYATVMDLTFQVATLDLLAQNTTPAIVLAGAKEIVFPQNVLAATAPQLPGIAYTVVPNAATFLMVDQPEVAARIIHEYFQSSSQPARFDDETTWLIEHEVREYTQRLGRSTYGTGSHDEVQIDLLNSFQVTVNGHSLRRGWNQRYAKQILAFLLFHPTTTREQLCEALWPETPLPIAKNNLRVYVSYLKKMLHTYSRSQSILSLDREHIFLHGRITSDAVDFIKDVQDAIRMNGEAKQGESTLQLFERLTSSQYLTAIYDDWFLTMRHRLEQDLVHLASVTGQWLCARGETGRAHSFLQHAQTVLDDDEALLR